MRRSSPPFLRRMSQRVTPISWPKEGTSHALVIMSFTLDIHSASESAFSFFFMALTEPLMMPQYLTSAFSTFFRLVVGVSCSRSSKARSPFSTSSWVICRLFIISSSWLWLRRELERARLSLEDVETEEWLDCW